MYLYKCRKRLVIMFGKKKEAKRAKEYKLEAPSLPSKGPPIPPTQVPPRTYKSPYASENPEPRDNTATYPGTWKPRRDVPPVPPSVNSIPTGFTDRSSFDEDEYAAPGVEVPGEEVTFNLELHFLSMVHT